MRGYVGVSRFLAALVLAFLVWSDLPAPTTRAVETDDATISAERSVAVSNRGGPRPPSTAAPGRDILTARPQVASPTQTPSPTPRPPEPSPTPTPELVLKALGQFRVTGYSDSPYLNGTDGRGITRSGEPTRWGVVAVDPWVIPLGTNLVIEGMEGTEFTALDTGGAVHGRRVDVWFPTDWDAIQHGVQYRNVYLVAK